MLRMVVDLEVSFDDQFIVPRSARIRVFVVDL